MEQIKLNAKQKYFNFVKNSSVSGNLFIPNSNSEGFFVMYGNDKAKILSYGETKKHSCKKTRIFIIEDNSSSFCVNGNDISGKSCWVKSESCLSEAFIEKEKKKIKISFATNGYLCINNNLIHFEGIEMKDSIPIKNKAGKIYLKNKDISKIFLNGDQILFENDGEKFFIPRFLDLTENFFVQYKDGTFSNVSNTFVIPDIFIPVKTLFSVFTKNFRCEPPSIEPLISNEKKEETIEFSVTRFNNETVTTFVKCIFVTPEEFTMSKISVDAVHESQVVRVLYSKFSSVDSIAIETIDESPKLEKQEESFFGSLIKVASSPLSNSFGSSPISFESKQKNSSTVEGKTVTVNEMVTLIRCIMKDGSEFLSKIIKHVLPYNKSEGNLVRFTPGIRNTFVTDEFYMVDGEIFEKKDSKNILIELKEGNSKISLYNKQNKTWTDHEIRMESFFSQIETYKVHSKISPIFNLQDLGMFDFKDTFKFFVNGESIQKPKYYINTKNSKIIDDEEVLEEVKFSFFRQEEKKVFNLKVKFVLDKSLGNTYSLEGDEYFPQMEREKTVKEITYGNFVLTEGSHYLFQNKVDKKSKVFKKHPILIHNKENIIEIKTCEDTLPIKTIMLNEDLKIDISANSNFVRYNHCSDILLKNSVLTVPKTTSCAFFGADNKIFLIKSGMMKSVSFNDSFSPALKHRKSITEKPSAVSERENNSPTTEEVSSFLSETEIPFDNSTTEHPSRFKSPEIQRTVIARQVTSTEPKKIPVEQPSQIPAKQPIQVLAKQPIQVLAKQPIQASISEQKQIFKPADREIVPLENSTILRQFKEQKKDEGQTEDFSSGDEIKIINNKKTETEKAEIVISGGKNSSVTIDDNSSVTPIARKNEIVQKPLLKKKIKPITSNIPYE